MADTPKIEPRVELPSETGRLHVLVVDDEPAIAGLLHEVLSRRGLVVHLAHSAAGARAAIERDPRIGVMVSDIRMPEQTGLSLASDLLRTRQDALALEVILVTGDITTDDAVGAVRARAFDFLKKPFRLAQVVDSVDRALASASDRRRRAAREADLRERMQAAEAERHRLADRLAHSTARLEDTQSTLAMVERARGDLFAVIGHELRTPLIPILGFSELIARTPGLGMDEIRGYAQMINEGGTDLLALIEAVLDILALDQGEGLADPGQELVATLVGRVTAGLDHLAAARRVALWQEGPADLVVTGDLARIAQALGELIDNAIKASPPGGRVEIVWDDPGEVRIDVLDRGPGVPRLVLDRLGTPFVQGDMSTTRAWPGAGLGLALVTRIAQAHGGRLTLSPRPEGGTGARLILPHLGD